MTRSFLFMSLALSFLIGCSSSPYNYYVDPTPIASGQAKYKISDVKVSLTLGHGAIEGDTSFASEETLTKQFSDALQKSIESQGLSATSSSDNAFDVVVQIDYTRIFNYGGKALNKPEVSHSVIVEKDRKKLAGFGRSNYTTKYAYLKDVAVMAEISAFKWGADDELEDVNLIAELIVEDLAKLGK